jgi:hypothetical protein
MLTPEEQRQNLKEYHQTKEYKKIRNKELFEKRLKQTGDTEKIDIYPAGRGKKLIIKTVVAKKTKRQKNPKRLCLCSFPSNPENVNLSVLQKGDGEFTFWIYPEGRRLDKDEFNIMLGCLLAYRKFRWGNKKGSEFRSKSLGFLHLSLKLTDREILKVYNSQLKRISEHYSKVV